MAMHTTGKPVPTCRTRQAVWELTVSGFAAVMPYGTGQWCRGAPGTVMAFRTSVTRRPSILWCGRTSPRETEVPGTTLAWSEALSRGSTEEAWFDRKLTEIKTNPDSCCKIENIVKSLHTRDASFVSLFYHRGRHKLWYNYLTFRHLIIISSKWCLTWRAGQTVLRFCHPSVRIYGSSWTRVLVFGPGPEWAVMTKWTLITPQQRAIMSGTTIKPIQIKKKEKKSME